MKFLFVCSYFAPYSLVAAVRPTKLAKHLKRQGHQVFVITKRQNKAVWPSDADLYADYAEIGSENVLIMEPSRLETALYPMQARMAAQSAWERGAAAPAKPGKPSLITRISPLLYELMGLRCWGKNKRKLLAALPEGGFDCIFSTYGPLMSHQVAGKLRKKMPGMAWIADFRDQVAVPWLFGRKFTGWWVGRYIRRVMSAADAVTVVSEGLRQHFLPYVAQPERLHVLRNGFDMAGTAQRMERTPHDKMRLTYAGALYAGKRDLRPVMRALSELAKEGKLDPARLEIRYMGNEAAEMHRMLREAPMLQPDAVVEGYLPRHEALAAQRESDLLLLASWNTREEQGIMTGKVYEYLQWGLPIVTVIAGDLPGSELREMLLSAGQGCVYEQAADARDYPLLKTALLSSYQAFLEKGFVPLLENQAQVAQYSYQHLAGELLELVAELAPIPVTT